MSQSRYSHRPTPDKSSYKRAESRIAARRRRWVVTGGAGFIGSHLVERLLTLGQDVLVIDDFSTGRRENLADVRTTVGPERAARLAVEARDLASLPGLARLLRGADVVLHEAALGSVPRSIARPADTHHANVDGTFRLLKAAVDAGVARVVFASSSSVYGDDPVNPREEARLGRPLSPYAASKRCGELYMEAFATSLGLSTVSLRYFNVFGPRQDPEGGYAAVIPRWICAALDGRPCEIYGDGLTTRDFCYVENVVRANLLAALATAGDVNGRVFNIGCGDQTSLQELHTHITDIAAELTGRAAAEPSYHDFRPGDVRHSRAVIDRARGVLSYEPVVRVREGLRSTVEWYAGGSGARRLQPTTAVLHRVAG